MNLIFFPSNFTPDQYIVGHLVKSLKMADAVTMILYLREGVRWQDKEPVNGREFSAYDVQAHYDRIL